MPQYELEKDIITKKCDVCSKNYLVTRYTKTCVHCGYNKKNKSQHPHIALDLTASSFSDGIEKLLSSNKYFGNFEKKVVLISVILFVTISFFFQQASSISGRLVFSLLAAILGLFIGIGVSSLASLLKIFEKLSKPLNQEATKERYKEWKENKVSKKDK